MQLIHSKTITILVSVVISHAIIAQQTHLKIETLIDNFPANGYVQVDTDGNLYVSEYGIFRGTGGSGTRVYKISPQGKVMDSITHLSGPMGTVKDEAGNLYINNDNNTKRGTILKIDKTGKRSDFSAVKGWPIAMKSNDSSTFYFTNYNSPEIYKMDLDGNVSVHVKNDDFIGTAGLDFDSEDNLIVANFITAKIFSISPQGNIKLIAHLEDIVVNGWGIGYITIVDDFIYATGIAVNKIFKVSMNGDVERFAGNGDAKGKNGYLLEASLYHPNGIAGDKKNRILYISEYAPKGGIRKIKL
ncbi:MAG: hypothetical protein AAFP76_12460 [Bacteroidota bacterium]